MRNWIDLVESWYTTIDDGAQHDVFVNPSKSELAKLLREDSVVRAWATNSEIYAFKGSALLHHEVRRYISVSGYDSRIFLDMEGPYVPINTMRGELLAMLIDGVDDGRGTAADREAVERMIEQCRDHPALTRLYGDGVQLQARRTE